MKFTLQKCPLCHSLVGIAQNPPHVIPSHQFFHMYPGTIPQFRSCLYICHLEGSSLNPAAKIEFSRVEFLIHFQVFTIQVEITSLSGGFGLPPSILFYTI